MTSHPLDPDVLQAAYNVRAGQSGVTASKAHASAIGGGIGAAVAQIIVHIWPDMGPVEPALTILICAAAGWLVTYFAPANQLRGVGR